MHGCNRFVTSPCCTQGHNGTYFFPKSLQRGFSFTSTCAQVLPFGVERRINTFASKNP